MEVRPEAPLNTAQAVGALRSRLRLDWREPSTWIEVRVVGYDPEAAADLANAVANLYVSETKQANRQTIERSKTEFESQVEDRGEHLREQLSGLREIGDESGLGNLGGRKALLERQVRALQEALVAASTERVGGAATARDAALVDGGSLADGNPRVQAAQAHLSDLEDRERALLGTLGSKHPEVLDVQKQVEAARASNPPPDQMSGRRRRPMNLP